MLCTYIELHAFYGVSYQTPLPKFQKAFEIFKPLEALVAYHPPVTGLWVFFQGSNLSGRLHIRDTLYAQNVSAGQSGFAIRVRGCRSTSSTNLPQLVPGKIL